MEGSASFGYWVRRRRKALDLTQAALADRVGCTTSLIRKIETDERRPSRQIAEHLAAALAIEAEERATFLQVARSERGVQRLASPLAEIDFAASAVPKTAPAPARMLALPAEPTPFVGRAQELNDIVRRLCDPSCRLLTLLGPGGIGKTRLAVQAGKLLAQSSTTADLFADGILFVLLASVETPAGIVPAIAQVASFSFYDNAPSVQQLLDYLREKRLLLILDNFEHLLTGVDLLTQILVVAPHVKILVTSREALGLMEAWFHPIAGMDVQTSDTSPAASTTSDAVQLFVQCARRTQVGFALESAQPHIVRICQLVQGMPLAIEMAAAWLIVLPVEQIAHEIEHSLDILTARHQNMSPRHRSMRAVWESSWQMLEQSEREVLKRLSVCRGSFTQEAAMQIGGASLPTLAVLVEKSLLARVSSRRYQLHELLRQFATERLVHSGQEATAQDRHSAYYLSLLQSHTEMLTGGEQQAALQAIGDEFENVRGAWLWNVSQGTWAPLLPVVDALYTFCQIRSSYQDGADLFAAAAERFCGRESGLDVLACAQIQARRGAFHFFLGDYREAARLLRESLALVQGQEQPGEQAFILNMLGQIMGWQGDRKAARTHLRQSLALYRAIDDKSGTANVLHKLAQIHGSFGNYAEGKRLAQESLVLSCQLGRLDWMASALDVLGWTGLCLGAYAEAEASYWESLSLCQKIDNQLGIALALGGIGSVAWAVGGDALAEAEDFMQRSLAICRMIGHRHHVSSRLWYLSQIANECEDYRAAQLFAQEGLAVARQVESRTFEAYNLCSLGQALCGQDQCAAGRHHLAAGLRLAMTITQLPPLLIGLINAAHLWLRESEGKTTGEAQTLRAQAVEVLTAVRHHPACWHPFAQRATALIDQLHPGVANHGSKPHFTAESIDALAAAVASALDRTPKPQTPALPM